MADLTGNDIVKLLLPAWRRAMDEGRHRDGVLTAILGYFVLRERKDDTYDKMPLYWMQKATFLILEEFHNAFKEANKGNCSFCGRTEPDVRLAAGPSAFICDSCVATLGEVFKAPRH
jgi:hypothetical protein